MSRRFRVCDPNQPLLLPPSLQDWLPEAHPARFPSDVVDGLDLSAIYVAYNRKDGGSPSFTKRRCPLCLHDRMGA